MEEKPLKLNIRNVGKPQNDSFRDNSPNYSSIQTSKDTKNWDKTSRTSDNLQNDVSPSISLDNSRTPRSHLLNDGKYRYHTKQNDYIEKNKVIDEIPEISDIHNSSRHKGLNFDEKRLGNNFLNNDKDFIIDNNKTESKYLLFLILKEQVRNFTQRYQCYSKIQA